MKYRFDDTEMYQYNDNPQMRALSGLEVIWSILALLHSRQTSVR